MSANSLYSPSYSLPVVKNFHSLKRERVLAIYQSLIGWLIKISAKSRQVIVQTKWMKQAICNSVKIDGDKVIVIKPKIEFKLNNKSKMNLTQNHSFIQPLTFSIRIMNAFLKLLKF